MSKFLTSRITNRTAVASLLAVCGCVLFAATSSLCIAAPPGWVQTWSDEFDGTEVDATKWDKINWTTPHNNELQAYHPDRVTVSDGNLVLTADDADYGGKSYTSGKVESKIAQNRGRFEIRAKLPGTQGTWPAIWLLPATEIYSWPSQGEIDILENRGDEPNETSSAFHWGPNFQARQFVFDKEESSHAGQLANYHDSFHTYAVEWDENRLSYFVDDVNYYTVHNTDTNGFIKSQTAPMEINLNVAVGGDFVNGAQPNGSSVWPQQMLIDYVRVYERAENPPPVVFRNGNFDMQGGSLAGWSTFGDVLVNDSITNVSTHNEATISGDSALKLFGQFNHQPNFSGVTQGITVQAGDRIEASVAALVRALDDIVGDNKVEMKFDYFRTFGGKFGTSDYLGSKNLEIATAATANDTWETHVLTDTVPANAVEARLAIVFNQPGSDGGAIHIDDVSFKNLDLPLHGDADGDGDVDGADFLEWQRGLGKEDATSSSIGDFNFDGVVDMGDLEVWGQTFGAAVGSAIVAIPEPTSATLAVLALLTVCKLGLLP